MPVVQLVSEWDIAHVPPFPVVGLVTAEQNHCAAAWIEREQGPQVPSRRTELFQVVVPRSADRSRARATEAWPVLPQMLDRFPDVIGILRPQAAEPPLRLGCELDLPRHPSRVTSPPVTEQDAFVPSLSNQSPATLYNATNLPPARAGGWGLLRFTLCDRRANRFSCRRVPSTDRRRSASRSRCTRPSRGPPSRRGCFPA